MNTESSANNNNIIAQDSSPRKVEYTKGYCSSRQSYSSTSSRKSTSFSCNDQDYFFCLTLLFEGRNTFDDQDMKIIHK